MPFVVSDLPVPTGAKRSGRARNKGKSIYGFDLLTAPGKAVVQDAGVPLAKVRTSANKWVRTMRPDFDLLVAEIVGDQDGGLVACVWRTELGTEALAERNARFDALDANPQRRTTKAKAEPDPREQPLPLPEPAGDGVGVPDDVAEQTTAPLDDLAPARDGHPIPANLDVHTALAPEDIDAHLEKHAAQVAADLAPTNTVLQDNIETFTPKKKVKRGAAA